MPGQCGIIENGEIEIAAFGVSGLRVGFSSAARVNGRGIVGFRFRTVVREFRDLRNRCENGGNRLFDYRAFDFTLCHCRYLLAVVENLLICRIAVRCIAFTAAARAFVAAFVAKFGCCAFITPRLCGFTPLIVPPPRRRYAYRVPDL
jgi:ribosomal protein S14